MQNYSSFLLAENIERGNKRNRKKNLLVKRPNKVIIKPKKIYHQ